MASGIVGSGQAWQHPCVHHCRIRKQITGMDSKKVPETTRIILVCQSRNTKALIGGTNAWPRDRGVQGPGAEMVRDMENFSA